MTAGASLLVWLLLLLLLGGEFVTAAFPGARIVPPFIGLGMAVLVSMTFMRLPSARGAAVIFAIAGVFWLGILMGMGFLDPATRHDVPVNMKTRS